MQCPPPHCGPRGRSETPLSLFRHTVRYSTTPRGHRSNVATSFAALDRARANASPGGRPRIARPRTRANDRAHERGDATARTKTLNRIRNRDRHAFVSATWTRHGAVLPVVLLPRGRHAEAEAEDVGDRFVVHPKTSVQGKYEDRDALGEELERWQMDQSSYW